MIFVVLVRSFFSPYVTPESIPGLVLLDTSLAVPLMERMWRFGSMTLLSHDHLEKNLYYKEHLMQWLWITCQHSNWILPKVVFPIEYGDVIVCDVIVYQRTLNTSTIHSHHGWFQAALESSFSLARCLRNLLGCCLSLLLGGFQTCVYF